MKKTLIILFFCIGLFTTSSFGQEASYNVNGETYILKEAVTGELTLLWNTIDGEFRYFAKKGDDIYELKNTKDDNGKFQEEYKETLRLMTADSKLLPDETDLTLNSLKYYFNSYNKDRDASYEYNVNAIKLKTRLGIFGGVSNNPYVTNPENAIGPIFGAEFEIYEDETAKRHAGFIEFKQSLKSGDFEYQSSQFSLNYRFRFIYQRSFNIYAQVKFATFTASSDTVEFIDEDSGVLVRQNISGSAFDTPLSLGIGSDIRIFNESFITLQVGEIAAAFLDNNGNFPIDLRLGYKFKL